MPVGELTAAKTTTAMRSRTNSMRPYKRGRIVVENTDDQNIFQAHTRHQTTLYSLDQITRNDIKHFVRELNLETALDRFGYQERRLEQAYAHSDLIVDRAGLVGVQVAHIARRAARMREGLPPPGAEHSIRRAIQQDPYAEHFEHRVDKVNAELRLVVKELAHLNWLLTLAPRRIGMGRDVSGADIVAGHFGHNSQDSRVCDMPRTYFMTLSVRHNVPVSGLAEEARELTRIATSTQAELLSFSKTIPSAVTLSIPKVFDEAAGLGFQFLKGLQAGNRSLLTTDEVTGDVLFHYVGAGFASESQSVKARRYGTLAAQSASGVEPNVL